MIKITEQGIKNVKDLPKRGQDGREAIEKACGKLLDWNFPMGEYDAIVKVELPDDYVAAVVALGLGKLGNVRSTILKAFSEDEMKKIVEKIP
ncbi:MAG: GYD domain-containing protein [Candidatus Bathyarchaeota archaeon]|nr:GYD domain-containing protein [Candidatus Bathyarchaeota archaeon]